MLKRTLILLAMLLSMHAAFARRINTVAFKQIDTIKESFYDHLRVIDMRQDKSNIGMLRKGILNSKAKMMTAKPLTEELSEAFKNDLKGSINAKYELVLVLYDLTIEDNPLNIHISTLHFDGDLYGSLKGQNVFLGKKDTFIEIGKSKKNLLYAVQHELANIFSIYARVNYKTNANLVFGDEGMRGRRDHVKQLYAAYRQHTFKKGIFYKFVQFLNNTPIDTPITIVELSLGKHADEFRSYYTDKGGKKGERIEEEDYFAICDSGILAFAVNDRCVEMIYKDGDYYATTAIELQSNVPFTPGGGVKGAMLAKTKYGRGIYYCKLNPEMGDLKPVKRLQ